VSTESKGHVSAADLVASIVAGEDLSPEARLHLQTCPECSRQRQRITDDLRALGSSARRFAPEPARKAVLPDRVPERSPARPWGWTLGLSFAAAAAAALILVLTPARPVFHPGGTLPGIAAVDRDDDAQLMAEVSRLEEDALPEGYKDISPEESPAGVDDDATLDFVIPIDDDGGLS
jgi:hypothetical protein